jgi:hypothetical protein
LQIERVRAECIARKQPAPSRYLAEMSKTLRDVENVPFRTFNRVQGARSQPPPTFYMSEYAGCYGSHPRMQPYWGTWGSLKTAGPFLSSARKQRV